MKNIKYYLLTLILLFIFSCRDAYEIVQPGELAPDAIFTTTNDMQRFLNSVYDKVDNTAEITLGGLLTDEFAIGNQNGGQNLAEYQFVINPLTANVNNGVGLNTGGIWAMHYRAINYANRLIDGAKNVPVPTTDAEKKRYYSIVAQARAIRSYCYLQLLTYFSKDLKDNGALGVVLLTDVPKEPYVKISRSTNGEVFAFIEGDLEFAANNINPVTLPTSTFKPYKLVSLDMINALRARMYAYRGNYTLAEQYADGVISGSGLNLTQATPFVNTTDGLTAFYGGATTYQQSNNPYKSMHQDLTQGEVIFSLDRPTNAKSSISSRFYFNRTSFTGGAFLTMNRKLFNIINEVSGDIRRYAFIDRTSLIDPNYNTYNSADFKAKDVLLIDKYSGRQANELTSDLKIFRLSEIYFIKAEALASKGLLNGSGGSVASILKAIRDARNYNGPTSLSNFGNVTEAWKAILDERRKELCFEGHRFIDLKRLGTLAGQTTTDRDPKTVEALSEKSIGITDNRFTFPIPTNEINANPSVQQNSGY